MPTRPLRTSLARALPAAVAVLLVTTLAPAHAADPDPRPVPEGEADASAKALEALETVEEVLQGGGNGEVDLSMALIKAKQLAPELPMLQKLRAQQLLQRPSDPGSPRDLIAYPPNADVHRDCTQELCVHWVKQGKHAPEATDQDENGTPDWVDTVRNAMQHTWRREVDQLGFPEPLPDNKRGGGPKLDVYLGDLGESGVYGYANTDTFTRAAAPGYLVLDNDYQNYPDGKPLDLLRATVAHEFFHLVQYAQTTNEDLWFMEATASWMEDQVYDGINDNRRYLRYSSQRIPARPLDDDRAKYGNWIFFQHLSEKHGHQVIRDMWRRAAGKVYSIPAINQSLRARGTNLKRELRRFAANNAMPARTYEEGRAFQRSRVARRWVFRWRWHAFPFRTARLNHLSSRVFVLRPHRTFGPRWRLRLWVDAPPRISRPIALVHRKDGTVRRRPITNRFRGKSVVHLDFTSRRVRKVTLILNNTSMWYRCNTGGFYACNGVSRDDRVPFRYRGVAFRK